MCKNTVLYVHQALCPRTAAGSARGVGATNWPRHARLGRQAKDAKDAALRAAAGAAAAASALGGAGRRLDDRGRGRRGRGARARDRRRGVGRAGGRVALRARRIAGVTKPVTRNPLAPWT